jgi:hypothetical protein
MKTWSEIACQRANRPRDECLSRLRAAVSNNSAGQFPVAGIVIERDKDAGGSTDGHISTFFKDGVTVWTAQSIRLAETPPTGVHLPGRQLSYAELQDAIADLSSDAPAGLQVQKYSRIAGVSAECFQKAKKSMPPVWEGSHATAEWLNVTRRAYLDALDNPQGGYVMFDLLAVGTCG